VSFGIARAIQKSPVLKNQNQKKKKKKKKKISIYEHGGGGGKEFWPHSDHSNAQNQNQVIFSLYNEQLQFNAGLYIPPMILINMLSDNK
jgi:hypothetical protein